MNTRTSLNWWALWAKRTILASLIILLAYVGGHGLLLIFNLEWQLEPFRMAVFTLGAATHLAVVVLLSEGKRTGQKWPVGLSVVAILIAAAMDGRFACEHILGGEGATVEASTSADALQADADRLQADLSAKESELSALRERTEIMDNDGDGNNDGLVSANRKVIAQFETVLADRRRELEDARKKVREAKVNAAGTAHSRSTTLQLADGLNEKQKIAAFWIAGSIFMTLLGAVIASATWTLGLMSAPESPMALPSADTALTVKTAKPEGRSRKNWKLWCLTKPVWVSGRIRRGRRFGIAV